jgi:hypothetical protein
MMSLLYTQVEQDVAWPKNSVESCKQAVQFAHQALLARKCAGSPQQILSGSLDRRHWVSIKFCVMQQNS